MAEIKNSGKASQWLDPNASNQPLTDDYADTAAAENAAANAQAQGALPNHVPVGTVSTSNAQAAGSVDGMSRTGTVKSPNYVARPEITSSGPDLPDVEGPKASYQQILKELFPYVRQPMGGSSQNQSDKEAIKTGADTSSSKAVGYTESDNHVSLVEVYNILGDAAQKGLDISGKIRIAAGQNNIESKMSEVEALKEKIAGEKKSAATTFAASIASATLTAVLAGRGTMMQGDPNTKFFGDKVTNFFSGNKSAATKNESARTNPAHASATGAAASNARNAAAAQTEKTKKDAEKAAKSKKQSEASTSNAALSSSERSAADARVSREASDDHMGKVAEHRAEAVKSKPMLSQLDDELSEASMSAFKTLNREVRAPSRTPTSSSLAESDTTAVGHTSKSKPEPLADESSTASMAPEVLEEKFGKSTSHLGKQDNQAQPNSWKGVSLQQSAQQMGGVLTEMSGLIDKLSGGKHEADQAEIQGKIQAVLTQIAQNSQESAKSSYDQALENIKNVFQTISQSYQRWAQVTDNISNR